MMRKTVFFFAIVSFVCHLGATSAETTGRTIEYHNKVPVCFPSFFEDHFFYGFCDEKLDADGVAQCQLIRISNIFGKNNVSKTCDFTFKTAKVEGYSNYRPALLFHTLGADYAVVYDSSYDDIVIIRFEDCKFLSSRVHESQAAELNRTFKELGINLDKIYKGFGSFTIVKKEITGIYGSDIDGNNAHWTGILFQKTTYASEAKKLARKLNASNIDFSEFYLYNKRGELLPIIWSTVYENSDPHSLSHNYLTLYYRHDDKAIIKQLDQDGRVKVTYQTDYETEPILAIYNQPEGGFYLLIPRNSTNSASLTKVNARGEGTHVLDVDNVKFELDFAKQEFNFYRKKDGELCLSWAYFSQKKSARTIDWFTNCFEDVKISENYWEKALGL